MSEPNTKTSIDTLTKIINPIWNLEQRDTQVLDTSVNDRYMIKVHNQGRITQDQKDFRFLIQNKVDYLQYAESFFRIQFRVDSTAPFDDKVTFADDLRSLFFRIQVKLSNTIVEDRFDIPTIAATERYFWSDNMRSTVGTGMLAYDDRFRTPGSAFQTEVINQEIIGAPYSGQGGIGVVTKLNPTTVVVPADTFNQVISGNGIKWFMSRSHSNTGVTPNGTQVEGFFRLSDVCDFFKNYRSVTRGVILEVKLEKSPNYRCLQFPAEADANVVLAGAKIEWELPTMTAPPNTQSDSQSDGVTLYVPVYRPSPVMLNILEERLARTIQTDVMYERADVYTSTLTGSESTWRIVTTPFKMTKAIIYFRIYDGSQADQKTLSVLHSATSNARMTNVSLNLNGNPIPMVADLQSYFSEAYGQKNGTGVSLINDGTANANPRLKKASYPYQQYLEMCKSLAAAYPSSNFTGGAGLSYDDFLYNYPLWCFNIATNYGEAEANDRQTSSLILNWKSLTNFPDATDVAHPILCEAVCVLYTLHQVNVISGSAQESQVRVL